MEKLDKIKSKLNMLKAQNLEDLKGSEEEIERLTTLKEQLANGLDDAIASGVKEFEKTNEKIHHLDDLIRYQKLKHSQLERPLLTNEDYQQDRADLISGLEELTKDANNKIDLLLNEAKEIYLNTNATIDQVNNLFVEYKRDVLKQSVVVSESYNVIDDNKIKPYKNYISLIEHCNKVMYDDDKAKSKLLDKVSARQPQQQVLF